MKYTHHEIEADKYKPVGSLFMSLMDKDSIPPRVHQNKHARGIYNRSLPNTPFSLYPDEPSRAQTPDVGRRHFPERAAGQYTRENSVTFQASEQRAQTALRQRHAVSEAKHCPDHLGSDMVPREKEVSPVRQKRYVREPRGLGSSDTPIRIRLAGGLPDDNRMVTPVRRRSQSLQPRDHLGLHTLIPREEPVKERPVPPPMILTPRKTGIRMFPEKRSASACDRRSGIKMVRPPPHWRSATDRQWDFLELGVNAKETGAPYYRNQSSIGLGGGPVFVSKRETSCPNSKPNSPVQRWRGRGNAATPQRRSYDIITGRPLAY